MSEQPRAPLTQQGGVLTQGHAHLEPTRKQTRAHSEIDQQLLQRAHLDLSTADPRAVLGAEEPVDRASAAVRVLAGLLVAGEVPAVPSVEDAVLAVLSEAADLRAAEASAGARRCIVSTVTS